MTEVNAELRAHVRVSFELYVLNSDRGPVVSIPTAALEGPRDQVIAAFVPFVGTAREIDVLLDSAERGAGYASIESHSEYGTSGLGCRVWRPTGQISTGLAGAGDARVRLELTIEARLRDGSVITMLVADTTGARGVLLQGAEAVWSKIGLTAAVLVDRLERGPWTEMELVADARGGDAPLTVLARVRPADPGQPWLMPPYNATSPTVWVGSRGANPNAAPQSAWRRTDNQRGAAW